MIQSMVGQLQNFDYSSSGSTVMQKAQLMATTGYGYASFGVSKGVEFADSGADIGIQGLELVVPWLIYLVWAAKILIPLAAIAYASYLGYKEALKYWKQGEPSEYQLQIRNGELVNMGVGLSCWTLPGDQLVSFPSGIQ